MKEKRMNSITRLNSILFTTYILLCIILFTTILPTKITIITAQRPELSHGFQPWVIQEHLTQFKTKTGPFHCYTTTDEYIDITMVNDGHCDCSDGSDEPATGACADVNMAWYTDTNPLLASLSLSNLTDITTANKHLSTLTFTCQNKPYTPITILSSHVNDGVCDCCDGSDEWLNPGLCKNYCNQLALDSFKEIDQLSAHLIERSSLQLHDVLINSYKNMIGYQIHVLEAIESNLDTVIAQNDNSKLSFSTFLQTFNFDFMGMLQQQLVLQHVNKMDGLFGLFSSKSRYVDLAPNVRTTSRYMLTAQYRRYQQKKENEKNQNNQNDILLDEEIVTYYDQQSPQNVNEFDYIPSLPKHNPYTAIVIKCPTFSAGDFVYEACINERAEQFSKASKSEPAIKIGVYNGISTALPEDSPGFDRDSQPLSTPEEQVNKLIFNSQPHSYSSGNNVNDNNNNNLSNINRKNTHSHMPPPDIDFFQRMSLASFRQPWVARSKQYVLPPGTTPPLKLSFIDGEFCWNGVGRKLTLQVKCGLVDKNVGAMTSHMNKEDKSPLNLFKMIDFTEPSMCIYESDMVSPLVCEGRDLLALLDTIERSYHVSVTDDELLHSFDQDTIDTVNKIRSKIALVHDAVKKITSDSVVSDFNNDTQEKMLKKVMNMVDSTKTSSGNSVYTTVYTRHLLHPSLFPHPIRLLQVDQLWHEKFFALYDKIIAAFSKNSQNQDNSLSQFKNFAATKIPGYNLFKRFAQIRMKLNEIFPQIDSLQQKEPKNEMETQGDVMNTQNQANINHDDTNNKSIRDEL